MIKKMVLTISLIAWIHFAAGQSISNDVLASNGKSSTSAAIMLDFTVGELSVQSLTASGNLISQGFNQTYLSTMSVDDSPEVVVSILAFPNPTFDFVSINIESAEQIDVIACVYDTYGKIVTNISCSNGNSFKVDMTTWAAGIYYLKIASANSLIHIKTIKIQKLFNQ